jgi:hypothetical protein
MLLEPCPGPCLRSLQHPELVPYFLSSKKCFTRVSILKESKVIIKLCVNKKVNKIFTYRYFINVNIGMNRFCGINEIVVNVSI